jgi:hypothetical protein
MKINVREKLQSLHSSIMARMATTAPVPPVAQDALQEPAADATTGKLSNLAQRYRWALSVSPLVCFTILYAAETLLPKHLAAGLRNCVDLFRFCPMVK